MSNLILDRPAVRRELPKPQTWLLFGPSSALTADGRTSLQDLPAIALSRWAKDLTGKKFGRLTALHPVEKQESNLVWLCQCSCGKKTVVRSTLLSQGRTKSCGCLRNEVVSQRQFKNLRGKRFGRLTVIKLAGKDKHGSSLWQCLCDCTKQTTVVSTSLIKGHTKSCGCFHKERLSQSKLKNLQGQRFGRLTVLELVGKNKPGRYSWHCLCDCGKTVTVTSSSLVQGKTKSCGCIRNEKTRQRNRKNSGLKSANWNPLLTAEHRIRRRLGLNQVRRQIFLRDNYTCALCGQHGGVINAHHMEPWSKNPTLRFDRDNMVTLCDGCHKKFHRRFPAEIANSTNFVEWFKARKVSLSCQSFSPGRSQ
jgi:5-methylcytosine-specific restriction endonuclease McrA